MAYNVDDIYEKAKKAIEDNDLIFIEEIVAYLPISKFSFYNFFPTDSNEYATLREMIDNNKTALKSDIRKKLKKSDKAAELLALYRLASTPEEHKLLNQSYTDHTSKGKQINAPTFIFSDLSEDDEE